MTTPPKSYVGVKTATAISRAVVAQHAGRWAYGFYYWALFITLLAVTLYSLVLWARLMDVRRSAALLYDGGHCNVHVSSMSAAMRDVCSNATQTLSYTWLEHVAHTLNADAHYAWQQLREYAAHLTDAAFSDNIMRTAVVTFLIVMFMYIYANYKLQLSTHRTLDRSVMAMASTQRAAPPLIAQPYTGTVRARLLR
jgi:hypothetical protein